MANRLLQFFEYQHLPQKLQDVSKPICDLAKDLDSKLPETAEKTAGLRKLLEAKDCFVRAVLEKAVVLFLLLCLFSQSQAQEITVPEKLEAKTGKLTTILVKSKAKEVVYQILPVSKDLYEVFREYDTDSSVIKLRLLTSEDGVYYLVVSGATADKVKQVVCIITSKGKPGPTPPDPDPSPVITIAKHLTFIGAETKPESLVVNNDPSLRSMLKSAGVAVHVLKAGDPVILSKGLASAVAKAGGIPCVVLQDELGNVIDQGPMLSVQTVTALASKHIRR